MIGSFGLMRKIGRDFEMIDEGKIHKKLSCNSAKDYD